MNYVIGFFIACGVVTGIIGVFLGYIANARLDLMDEEKRLKRIGVIKN